MKTKGKPILTRAALGCSGPPGLVGLSRAALGCPGLLWIALGCSGLKKP